MLLEVSIAGIFNLGNSAPSTLILLERTSVANVYCGETKQHCLSTEPQLFYSLIVTINKPPLVQTNSGYPWYFFMSFMYFFQADRPAFQEESSMKLEQHPFSQPVKSLQPMTHFNCQIPQLVWSCPNGVGPNVLFVFLCKDVQLGLVPSEITMQKNPLRRVRTPATMEVVKQSSQLIDIPRLQIYNGNVAWLTAVFFVSL